MMNRGFTTITATLVIGFAAVSAVSVALLLQTDYARGEVIRERSAALESVADGCAAEAIQKLRDDNTYAGGEVITIGSLTCSIAAPLGSGEENRTVRITANDGEVYKSLEIVIDDLLPQPVISKYEFLSTF